jgi:Cys-tRNA(Pro)/Cys-tRNA(Cys) deacylase
LPKRSKCKDRQVAKKKAHTSAATPGLARLIEAGVDHTVRAYDHDDAASGSVGYGLEAAQALGVEPERVFKTLMVMAGRRQVLGVVPVSGQLDLKAMAAALGEKQVAMAPPEVAERVSGSVVGGISPLGGRTPLEVVLDQSATAYDTILVSAGKRGVDVELAPDDLLAVTGGRTAPIAR